MAEEIKALSAQLAQDPDSLVFLRLGELLRHKGQLDAAQRVALTGLQRHPHLADAHDLYARILADKHDYERAFDEWDMTLRIAPSHVGALKGLAFLYFKVGDIAQAVAHLEAAGQYAPDDPGVTQALALAQGGTHGGPPSAARAAAAAAEELAPAPAPLEEERVFAGLEGAQEGLLLLDASGRMLGGALKDREGRDVTDAVAAYLAGEHPQLPPPYARADVRLCDRVTEPPVALTGHARGCQDARPWKGARGCAGPGCSGGGWPARRRSWCSASSRPSSSSRPSPSSSSA